MKHLVASAVAVGVVAIALAADAADAHGLTLLAMLAVPVACGAALLAAAGRWM